MIKTVVVLVAAVVVANAMMRPIRIQNYDDCSCEHHETDPCDEEEEPSTPPKTVPTTPSTSQKTTTQSSTSTTVTSTTTQTTPPSTTSQAICPVDRNRYVPIKRKNGYWCGFFTQPVTPIITPLSYAGGERRCTQLGAKVASLETEAESIYWSNMALALLNTYPVSGFWVKSDYNATSESWYWSDGHADPTMNPQPTVRDPNGKVAALVGSERNKPCTLEVVSQDGRGPGIVNVVLCGVPGLQFS